MGHVEEGAELLLETVQRRPVDALHGLQRDVGPAPAVMGPVHDAHAAAAQLVEDVVPFDDRPGRVQVEGTRIGRHRSAGCASKAASTTAECSGKRPRYSLGSGRSPRPRHSSSSRASSSRSSAARHGSDASARYCSIRGRRPARHSASKRSQARHDLTELGQRQAIRRRTAVGLAHDASLSQAMRMNFSLLATVRTAQPSRIAISSLV